MNAQDDEDDGVISVMPYRISVVCLGDSLISVTQEFDSPTSLNSIL